MSWSWLKMEGPTWVSAAPNHILGLLGRAVPQGSEGLCYQSSAGQENQHPTAKG